MIIGLGLSSCLGIILTSNSGIRKVAVVRFGYLGVRSNWTHLNVLSNRSLAFYLSKGRDRRTMVRVQCTRVHQHIRKNSDGGTSICKATGRGKEDGTIRSNLPVLMGGKNQIIRQRP